MVSPGALRCLPLAIIWLFAIATSGCGQLQADAAAHSTTTEYDVVIRNGRVLDGAGNPWVLADIAIKDGRFVEIGHVEATGLQEIDATGLYVTPGWIDAMDQSGAVLLKSGRAENKLLMGVTTVVAGEGGTPVPAAEIGEYFDQLEDQGISINFATFYNATQARIEVIGDAARTPSPAELDKMKSRIEMAMQAGALGVTTALIYPPATFQSKEELIELTRTAAKYDGIYATHMRDEGRHLIPALEEAIEIGEKAGAKVHIFHLKAAYRPGWGTLMDKAGDTIDAARARGLDVAADVYPYVAGGTGFEPTLPPEVFADGQEAAVRKLQDHAYRENLIRRIEAEEFGEWSKSNLVAAAGGWDGVILANAHDTKLNKFAFRSIADIAQELDRNPYDLIIDMMIEALPERAVGFYFLMSEDDVRTALQFPWTSIGSDAAASVMVGEVDDLGLPHPRAYGTFPRIISEYVRKNNVLTIEDAVRKMTSWPATRFGFRDRGLIGKGMWADVVIFDYDRIEDRATWENGTAVPVGINYVLVNGVIAIDEGKHTGAAAGRVLRRRSG